MNEESWNNALRGRVVGGLGVLGGGGSPNPATREAMVEGSWKISAERVEVCLGVN